MSDYLVRVMTTDGSMRALACVTGGLAAECARRQGTLPTASVALARALTAGTLMGALLKTGQRVALKFEGNGPLQKVIVEADSNGAVRGMVGNPAVYITTADGRLDVAGGIGRAGFLTVTKDLGLKEPYRSTVQLVKGEVAEDLAHYLTESEQIPSAVGLGVSMTAEGQISSSGGFLIQALPPQNEELIALLMQRIGVMPSLSTMLAEGKTPEDILDGLFAGITRTTLEKRALAFVCSCGRERIERVLLSLGSRDLADLLETQGETDVTCEFCRTSYHFDGNDLRELLRQAGRK